MQKRELAHSEYFVRQATIEDIKQITSRMLAGSAHMNEAAIQQYLWEIMNGRTQRLYVLTDNSGAIHAQCTLFIEEKLIHQSKAVGHIEDLVVYAAQNRAELERLILLEIQVKALQAGCYKVVLSCEDEDKQRFECLGFNYSKQIMGVYFNQEEQK